MSKRLWATRPKCWILLIDSQNQSKTQGDLKNSLKWSIFRFFSEFFEFFDNFCDFFRPFFEIVAQLYSRAIPCHHQTGPDLPFSVYNTIVLNL